MSNSKVILSFPLFFFFISFSSASSFNDTHKCSPQQALSLLLFKQNLSSINHNYDKEDYYVDYPCQRWLGFDYHAIMMSWNKNTDCCKWDGINCNHFTGDVIDINLSCGMLRGTIHPNTTLFHLPHLQTLNLAYNKFTGSQFPHEIHRFFNSLTNLNISHCGIIGEISLEILHLPKLVSLDLSLNGGLKIQPYVVKNLLLNSTHLREVVMTGADIGWVLPTYLNISSSLKSLDLSWTGLRGILPNNIFSFPYFEKLDLSGNVYLTGPLPKVNTSNNIHLKWLGLSFVNLSGMIPDSISRLKSLSYLDLTHCGLVGPLPKFLLNLRHLTTLHLENNMLDGTLPSFLYTFPFLENIYLSDNMFNGGLSLELFKCRSLKKLYLRGNQFNGEINQGSPPISFIKLVNLTYLDLSWNDFSGVWDLDTFLSSVPNLQLLDLSYSGLSVVSDNSFGYVNPDFQYLNLASCKLNLFPECLRAMKKLEFLDISSNNIHGHIPNWVQEIGGNDLLTMDLSNNSITGLPQFQWDGLKKLDIGYNQIQGMFPSSICNMRKLYYLDISNNNFSGMIPRCLGNIFSLAVVDLGYNRFHGSIPDVYEECGLLEGLILKGNQLHGEVPSSLSKCESLTLLDLGNNQLSGPFPHLLGNLPVLRVLVLKSNQLHGPIESPSTLRSAFPSIRVLDISHNWFVGFLPRKYLQNFNAMKNVVNSSTKPTYLSTGGTYYSITTRVKGMEQEFPKFLVDYAIIDMSNNRFQGGVPDIIGCLTALIVLDLSNNRLTGQIPSVLGNLSEIESLDLSMNQLSGEIPFSLAGLNFLGFLNLSENHFVGRIPSGTQFSTFGNSFRGNPKLCGLPLPKKCEDLQDIQLEVNGDGDEERGFTWRWVMLGYGCGTIIGLVMGYIMFSIERSKWFNAIVDAGVHMIIARGNKRRFVYIGR